MKKLSILIVLFIVFSWASKAISPDNDDDHNTSHQVGITIPEVTLIEVNGPEGTSINLTPDISSMEAGDAVDFGTATNNSLWLNYTSITGKGSNGQGHGHGNAKTRKIKAELDQNLPGGLDLMLEVSPVTSGSGQTGTAAEGKIKLKKSTSWVIDNIGSCYTENGVGKGHRLTYSLDVKDNQFDKVVAENFSVQVTYTITEN